jgi:hypothetical protein
MGSEFVWRELVEREWGSRERERIVWEGEGRVVVVGEGGQQHHHQQQKGRTGLRATTLLTPLLLDYWRPALPHSPHTTLCIRLSLVGREEGGSTGKGKLPNWLALRWEMSGIVPYSSRTALLRFPFPATISCPMGSSTQYSHKDMVF